MSSLYLGLGYEHCTWETPQDMDDDKLIGEFRRLNNMVLDEPELTVGDVRRVIGKTKHIMAKHAGGFSYIPDLRAQLYAQTRAFQFSKFGQTPPSRLCMECGPKIKASSQGELSLGKNQHLPEVVECVADLVSKVSRSEGRQDLQLVTDLPPLMTGEYDAVVPITSKGLMMNVGEINGSVAFLGYRQFPDGSMGPSEIANLIRNVGDKIIAVDGKSTINKSFREVIMMLRESGKNSFGKFCNIIKLSFFCHFHPSGRLTAGRITGHYIVFNL